MISYIYELNNIVDINITNPINTNTGYIYLISSFLAGLFAKLYDDLVDNEFLQKYNTVFLQELLKGIHYILFTVTSLNDGLFYIMLYLVVTANFFGDKEAFQNPYEFSLFFSLSIIIFLSKGIHLKLNFLDIVIFLIPILFAYVDSYFFYNDVSFNKMFFRSIACFVLTLLMVCSFSFLSVSIKYLILYYLGYCFLSVLIQYYSLYIVDKEDIHIIHQEKDMSKSDMKENINEKEINKENETNEENENNDTE